MKQTIKNRLYLFKSRTIRWFSIYIPTVAGILQIASDTLTQAREYIPEGIFKTAMVVCLIGLALRRATDKPLSDYKEQK